MAKPYLTTDDLVEAVKLNISLPIAQTAFSEDDIIAFLNKEMMISQVPSVMEFHEEYFVHTVAVPLESEISRYQIPNRAIGMKINDVNFEDSSGNLHEMTKINSGDKAYFQSNLGTNAIVHKYYIKGNYIVLSSDVDANPSGSLLFDIFLRPNQLVSNDRAATIETFNKKVTIDIATMIAGDTLTIGDLELIADTDFTIGATSILTATNIVNAIFAEGTYTANNTDTATAIVNIDFETVDDVEVETSNAVAFAISDSFTIGFDEIPENIEDGVKIDFLQTNPGHQIYDFDIQLSDDAIYDTIYIDFDEDDIPDNLEVGDYICQSHESIIPCLPPELHNVLVERASAKILASMGDQAGLAASQMTIAEMEKSQGVLIDNRVENSPKKVLPRTSPLRLGKQGWKSRI